MDVKRKNGNIIVLLIQWTSDGSGDATKTISGYFGHKINKVQVLPGTEGVAATNPPLDLFDVTITDEFGEDIMAGELIDCSNAAATSRYAVDEVNILGTLTINISGAGATNDGLINVYLEQVSQID